MNRAAAPSGPPARLAVVGAVNLDLSVAVEQLPAPGETVVGPELHRHGGGKGANAAVAGARIGAAVTLVGAIGDDDAGRQARAELEAEGIDCAGLATLADTATGVALISVSRDGENQITVAAGANLKLAPGWVTEQLRAVAGELACVLISTEIPDDAVLAAVRAAAEAGVPCVLNPAPPIGAVRTALPDHPILTPNQGELAELAAALELRGDDPAAQAGALADRTGAPVLVTLGGDGAVIAMPSDADTVSLPPTQVEVVDTTGAGDTVNGVFSARLAAGDDVIAAARTAVIAGSLSTTGPGARGGMPDLAAFPSADHPAADHSSADHSAADHSAADHSAADHSTAEHSAAADGGPAGI